MRLADLVSEELNVNHDEIVLFRHTEEDAVLVVNECGATPEEWTSIQPVRQQYDYRLNGKTKVLVVLMGNFIYGVFRLDHSKVVEGKRDFLSSEQLQESYKRRSSDERNLGDELAFRIPLQRARFSKDGQKITGWEGKEIRTIAKSTRTSGERSSLFWGIEV